MEGMRLMRMLGRIISIIRPEAWGTRRGGQQYLVWRQSKNSCRHWSWACPSLLWLDHHIAFFFSNIAAESNISSTLELFFFRAVLVHENSPLANGRVCTITLCLRDGSRQRRNVSTSALFSSSQTPRRKSISSANVKPSTHGRPLKCLFSPRSFPHFLLATIDIQSCISNP